MDRTALKDDVFLRMALELSRLGTCCRLKVGCVLLRPDGGVASGGYNGALPGMPHCTPATCGPGMRCLHTSHAEENALGFCDGPVHTAYVTDEPCLTCTRALVRRGIRRVVFLRPYTSIAEQERLERQGILDHFGVEWHNLGLDLAQGER
jgi:dCMP deaminase